MENNKITDIKNKKHIQEVYKDKANTFLNICIIILVFDALTYLIAIYAYNAFDFGFIFEAISFLFILFAKAKLSDNDFYLSKIGIIISMIPIGLLILYDFMHLLANIKEVVAEVVYYFYSFDRFFYYLLPYLVDIALVALIFLLYKALSSINKVNGSTISNNYVDTFYDNL